MLEQEEKGATEDEMVGWHHQLNGHGFKQTQGDSERQGRLACCKFMAFQRVGHDLVAEQQTAAHQAPLSMEFSRQEYWSMLPFSYSRRSS